MSDEAVQPAAVESRPRKRWIGILVVLALVLGAGTAGALVGPRLASRIAGPAAAKTAEESQPDDIPPPLELEALVVDVRDGDDGVHHLKVGLALEIAADASPEHVKNLVPRGREAAIAYLRSKSVDELTGSKRFATVSQELSASVMRAFGRKHVKRVVITDFVSQ
ncbi:MAG: flagellar basal body-associated FliL family protein [Polyangiaceae bacterium]|nr:flagellar basal body-associated FliL family protein [Polyangiaceae bacterium]